MNNKISNLFFKILLVVIPMFVFVLVYAWAVYTLTAYFNQTFTDPFLDQPEGYTHNDNKKVTTTKPLLIEFQVSKVNKQLVKK